MLQWEKKPANVSRRKAISCLKILGVGSSEAEGELKEKLSLIVKILISRNLLYCRVTCSNFSAVGSGVECGICLVLLG